MPLLETLLAGVIGTAGMTLIMGGIQRSGWARADMIRALGSLATKSDRNAIGPGLVIHLTSGILFAFFYALLMSMVGEPKTFTAAGIGLVIGLFHGIVVSFLLVSVVSDLHPLEKFRKAGIDVAVAHIAGHAAYGCFVGMAIGALGIDLMP